MVSWVQLPQSQHACDAARSAFRHCTTTGIHISTDANTIPQPESQGRLNCNWCTADDTLISDHWSDTHCLHVIQRFDITVTAAQAYSTLSQDCLECMKMDTLAQYLCLQQGSGIVTCQTLLLQHHIQARKPIMAFLPPQRALASTKVKMPSQGRAATCCPASSELSWQWLARLYSAPVSRHTVEDHSCFCPRRDPRSRHAA